MTVGLAALVFGGRLERHRSCEFIAATAGGAIALLAGRLDLAYQPRHWGGRPGRRAPGGGGGPPPAAGRPR